MPDERTTEERLRELKALHDDGLITDDEFAEKRQIILDQIGEVPAAPTPAPAPVLPPSVQYGSDKITRAEKAANNAAIKAKGAKTGMPMIAKVALGVAAVVLVVAAIGSVGSTTGGSSSSASQSPLVAACGGAVVYRVTGTAAAVAVTMENSQGNTEQMDNMAVPFRKGMGNFDCGDFIYISAQNQGESGTVTCIIRVDGLAVETATSSGEYVIASCSGSTP